MKFCSWKEIYICNLQNVFTETRLEDEDLTKTKPCKYFVYMERGNPRGGGVLPYMGYIGTCRGIGYGF